MAQLTVCSFFGLLAVQMNLKIQIRNYFLYLGVPHNYRLGGF